MTRTQVFIGNGYGPGDGEDRAGMVNFLARSTWRSRATEPGENSSDHIDVIEHPYMWYYVANPA